MSKFVLNKVPLIIILNMKKASNKLKIVLD